MSANYPECIHCEKIFGCIYMSTKKADCLYFEPRKEEDEEDGDSSASND